MDKIAAQIRSLPSVCIIQGEHTRRVYAVNHNKGIQCFGYLDDERWYDQIEYIPTDECVWCTHQRRADAWKWLYDHVAKNADLYESANQLLEACPMRELEAIVMTKKYLSQ